MPGAADSLFKDRFRAALAHSGLDELMLASKSGISTKTLGRYADRETTPNQLAGVKAVALATGVSPDWLESGIGEMLEGQSDGGQGDAPGIGALAASAENGGSVSQPDDPTSRGLVRVPYYGRVGAGPPRVPVKAVGHLDVTQAEYAADFATPPRYTEGRLVASGGFGYFTVDGDSAAPVFFDGERVPVEVLPVPTDVFPQDTICVFRWDDGQMLKRLRRLPGGRVEAHALNPSIPPFCFHPGDDSEVFAVLAVTRVSPKQQLYTSLVGHFYRTDA